MICPGLGSGFAFFPFAAEDDAFALVADVDQHEVAFGAKHAALDDLIDGHFLGAPPDFLGGGILHRQGELLLPFLFAEVQRTYEVAIYHCFAAAERNKRG